jgi:hypothetical protein
MSHPEPHRWKFFRAGGFDQVRLDSGEDLVSLAQLDPKLWVALSCPTSGIELDEKTLAFIDTDGDKRIRVPEILAAVKWATSVLRDPAELTKPGKALELSAIDDTKEEGRRLLSSARQVLRDLGKGDATSITLEDLTDTARIFSTTRFNGDGVVPPETADDEAARGAIGAVIDGVGSAIDRSGKPGVTKELVEAFFAEAEAFSSWWKRAEDDAGRVLPLGTATTDAALALRAVRAKIEDYFARCRLAAYDPRALGPLNRTEADYLALSSKELTATCEELAGFPLAPVAPDRPLPLGKGINPAWDERIAALRAAIVGPLLGAREQLTLEEWRSILARLAPHEAWLVEKAGARVEKLGLARVRELLGPGGLKAAILDLIERDRALAPEAESIAAVEKLVRFKRDLFTLLNNFVCFRDFYTQKAKAIFQVGTLFLDGRSCDLCIRVEDLNKHSGVASLGRTYLAYCDCTRPGAPLKMTIAAAFTAGDSDFLRVGRNGVFYDRKGQDWDATVVKVVEHPISIQQAFWSPYKRIGRMIGEQIEKFAASRDKASQEHAAGAIAEVSQKVEAPKPVAAGAVPAPAPVPAAAAAPAPGAAPAPPAAFDIGKFVGIFAAIGLAIGAIGSTIAAIMTGFLKLTIWQMPIALAGVMLLVSGPSMLIAWLKLRGRNLGPLLDANGWAVNARAKINIPFGGALTAQAKLPTGAERSLYDPYAEKKSGRWIFLSVGILLAALAVLWGTGLLPDWLSKLKHVVFPPAAVSTKAIKK